VADHADIGPSGLQQVILCRGAYRMQKDIPRRSSYDSKLGTCAHMVGAFCLDQELDAKFYLGERFVVEDEEFVVDDDMASAVQVHLDFCRALPGEDFWLEQRVTVPVIDTWGTADFLKLDRATKTLYVVDYKHGKGVHVSGTENPQLMAYGLGGWNLLSVVEDIDYVEVSIVQPRIDNVTTERYAVADLLAWAERIAPMIAEARTNPGASLTPGEKQCRFCSAKGDCPAVKSLVQDTTGVAFDDLSSSPASVATIDFAAVLPKLDLIEDWCREVRAAAERALENGGEIAGFKRVVGRRGNRRWADPKQAEALMKERFRLARDEMYHFEVIGPPAAEKLLASASPRRWTQLQQLITQNPGRPTVVPISDKRPALTPLAAPQFDDLSEEPIA